MKLVLNKDYGGYGFGVAKEFKEMVGKYADERNAPMLVEFVETHPEDCGDLKVVEMPDEVTDWEIDEYDGWETLTYVVGGKLHHA